MKQVILSVSAVAILAGCAAGTLFGPSPKDGELAMPFNYKSWPVFLLDIEKPSGHIRDIYINSIGASTKKGESFPNETVSVMEIYKSSRENGQLTKGELEKVFVMYKNDNWGSTAPVGLKTSDWVYGAFEPNGQPAKVDYASCRGCHYPLAEKDHMFHYDKYFSTRKSMEIQEMPSGDSTMSFQDIHLATLLTK